MARDLYFFLCSSSYFLSLASSLISNFSITPRRSRSVVILSKCPAVLNVLLNDKTLHKRPPKRALDLALTLALDQNLFANFV
jgi:hypothetical protein